MYFSSKFFKSLNESITKKFKHRNINDIKGTTLKYYSVLLQSEKSKQAMSYQCTVNE